MSEHEKIWETYVASWRATCPDEKRAAYARSLSPECVYTDPLMQARGWDELLAYMQSFHEQLPGAHFVTKEFEAHHDRSLAKWEMRDANEKVLGEGVSYGEYAPDGKLRSMTGFFDTPEG